MDTSYKSLAEILDRLMDNRYVLHVYVTPHDGAYYVEFRDWLSDYAIVAQCLMTEKMLDDVWDYYAADESPRKNIAIDYLGEHLFSRNK